MAQLTTYSGSDVNCSLQSPLFGTIQFGGIAQTGLAEVSVHMALDHASTQRGMDGAIVPTYQPGEDGTIQAQVWQTSTTQQQLTQAYDAQLAASLAGDVTQVFNATLVVIQTNTGATHTATGVSIQKYADKAYGDQATRVTWVFVCCNIVNEGG